MNLTREECISILDTIINKRNRLVKVSHDVMVSAGTMLLSLESGKNVIPVNMPRDYGRLETWCRGLMDGLYAANVLFTVETCPHCGTDQYFTEEPKHQHCNNCGRIISLCSTCSDTSRCEECVEERKKLGIEEDEFLKKWKNLKEEKDGKD